MRSHFQKTTFGLVVMVLTLAGCVTSDPVDTPIDIAPLAELALLDDGLGDVLLGVPPEDVIADVSALFGEPDHDSDWIVSEPNTYGSCPGVQMRAIGWGSLMTIFVIDSADELGARFYTYTYGYDYADNVGGVDPRGLGLTTATGIGLGSTTADLSTAYGSALVIEGDADLDVWSFQINGSEIRGLLSGPDETDVVTLIELATGC